MTLGEISRQNNGIQEGYGDGYDELYHRRPSSNSRIKHNVAYNSIQCLKKDRRYQSIQALVSSIFLNRDAVDEAGDPWIGCAYEEVLGRAVEADFAVLQEEHAVRCFHVRSQGCASR